MKDSARKVLEKYEVRKTRCQKSEFISYILDFAKSKGYSASVERKGKNVRNIVVGNPDSASVIYTAHYDTCPRLPFPNFITPKNVLIYVIYQLALTAMIIALPVLFALGAKYALESLLLPDDVIYLVKTMIEYGGIIGIVYLMMMGPANPHTANDNTSGVTTIVSIMEDLPENLRENVAFIFFDLEEVGLLGSAAFYASHKKNVQDKLLLNFDCVSDGKNILFAIKKGAVKYTHALKAAFPETEIFKPDFATKGFFYPSDQVKFPMGVGVAALKKSKRGILYMNRIHTAKDTVFDEANIDYLTQGALKLAEIISIS